MSDANANVQNFNRLVIGNMEMCHPSIEEPVKITGENGHVECFPRAFSEGTDWIKPISKALDDNDKVRIYFTRSRQGYVLDPSGDVYRRDVVRDDNNQYLYSTTLSRCGEWELVEHEPSEKTTIYERGPLGVMEPRQIDSYVFEERDGVKYHSPYVKFSIHLTLSDVVDYRNGKKTDVDITLPIYECKVSKVKSGFRKVAKLIEKRMKFATEFINQKENPTDGSKPWRRPVLKAHEGLIFSPNVLEPGMAKTMRFPIFETESESEQSNE